MLRLRVYFASTPLAFRETGAWIDEDTAFREHLRPPFTIVLIHSGAQLLARPAVVDALGFADPGVSRAHVIYDRVEALTARSPRSAASLLGDVIAHELGHLLLPSPQHSARGIMRSGVDVHTRPLETFTDSQARQIVSRLTHVPLQSRLACRSPLPLSSVRRLAVLLMQG